MPVPAAWSVSRADRGATAARRRPARRAAITTCARWAACPSRSFDELAPLGRAAGDDAWSVRRDGGIRPTAPRSRARHQAFEEQVDHAVGQLARRQLAVGAVPLVDPQHHAEEAERGERRVDRANLAALGGLAERRLEEAHVALLARVDLLRRGAGQRLVLV